MALKLADRVREISTSTGTGDIALSGAVSGYQAFGDALSVGDTTWYAIVGGGEWETGEGTLSGAGTLQRDTVFESSNAGGKVNFGSGTKDVFVTVPAKKSSSFAVGDTLKTARDPGSDWLLCDGSVLSQASNAELYGVLGLVPDLGWNTSTASYTGDNFDPSISQPYSVAFKPDGSLMFMVNSSDDTLYSYSLSTPWDITTASYTGDSFWLEGEEAQPSDAAFNQDGTLLFVVGASTDTVYAYELSTPWDITTASYTGDSFTIGGQEGIPYSVAFKPDGSLMFILGWSTDTVYAYELSTPWDITTASYTGNSLDVSGQESFPYSVAFKPDGSLMFMAGTSTGTLYSYSLSTPWDITTASYTGDSFDFGGQDSNPYSVAFKPDGSLMFVVGASTDTVYAYELGYDASTQFALPTIAADQNLSTYIKAS